MKRWYIVEQGESHIVGEGYQTFTTDKIYAEQLLKELNKQRELKMIDFTPVMREATEEEIALLNFDLDTTTEEETTLFNFDLDMTTVEEAELLNFDLDMAIEEEALPF